ncbi:hypothetical protein MLP_52480 [Microlunatus phosphovorus NM-1]|uniref:Uncharacterized protein n=1 Tax=Microlunatus phosphovorus (strain ATCC 700054 / DSM 10555 / JCM 9379 / NBRC 101784 / NCIMB 13414 / VKM Ac-1990 / NM-1) TaxID=1032480 RepID=F5XIM4_MICPN|nr:hypothetical protein [Microlunatus phosphovorus]BAK38262.1 hypothetical protein MLP_52480 [Microlunatus phosphovorus NM-1]
MTRGRKPPSDLGTRLTQLDRILGVHVNTDPVDGLDLIVYHRGPVGSDSHLAICQILLEHGGRDRTIPGEPRRLRPVTRPAPLDWAYRDLDQMHRLALQVTNGQHHFEFDPGHVHLLPDFQPLADLARGGILADPSGELTLLHRRLQRYPSRLGDGLVARLWEIRPLLDAASGAADRGDTTGTAAGLTRAADLAAHALHGHAGTWPPHPAQLLSGAQRLACTPPSFAGTMQRVLAQLGTRPGLLRDAVATTSVLMDGVVVACRPRRQD